ncbi:MAG TPA: PA2817 family protein [Marinobacterium sp.]|nr:PA2817 family protein [Marinobacterium sp.]
MTSFHQFHLNLLKLGYNNLIKQPPFDMSEEGYSSEADELLALFQETITLYQEHADEAFELGQILMTRLVRNYPQLTQLLARDLLWLFGGDCIHYLNDEEIEQFQALDEARYVKEGQNEPFDYLELRNAIMGAITTTPKH